MTVDQSWEGSDLLYLLPLQPLLLLLEVQQLPLLPLPLSLPLSPQEGFLSLDNMEEAPVRLSALNISKALYAVIEHPDQTSSFGKNASK